MWKASSGLRRVLAASPIVMLIAVAFAPRVDAQEEPAAPSNIVLVVRPKPASEADNAATLYALAIVELERSLPGDTWKWPEPGNARIIRLQGGGVVVQGRMVFTLEAGEQDEQFKQETSKALHNSVLARSLFAQAAARPKCVFDVVAEAALNQRTDQLAQLVDLIEMHALSEVDDHAIRACEDAFTLLRYARHCRAGSGVQPVLLARAIENRGLTLLVKALAAVCRDPEQRVHLGRYAAVIDTQVRGDHDQEDFARIFLTGIPALVEWHRGRLRDMHMYVKGGFDQPKMVLHLEQVTAKIVARPVGQDITFAEWLAAVDARMKSEVKQPAADASVTDKATYGMVQLILTGGNRLTQQIRDNALLVEQCRELLLTASKRR